MNNLQLDDAMICRLVDAHSEGVDFSHAIDVAHIPEMLAPSAKEYWDTLDGSARFRDTLLPRADIIERIFANAGSPVAERDLLIARPSPYMKYVMAFAVPMAVLVLVVGVALRPQENPITDNGGNAPVAMQTFSVSPAAAPAGVVAAKSAPTPVTAVAKVRAAALATKAVVPTAVKPVPKDDPRQLFAMLRDAGAREARSEATIDATYDAQIAALNATVVTPTNIQNNAPLQ